MTNKINLWSLLLFVTMIHPTVINANAISIDGIYYNIVEKAKAAEVTSNPEGYEFETLIIPEYIEYEGETYNVEGISDYAFTNCYNIRTISLPNSLSHIGISAFSCCIGLTNIIIPNSIKDLGTFAFAGCKGLKSATIGDGVSLLSDYMFSECTNLESIKIGKGVASIGNNVFYLCNKLKSVYISDLGSWFNIFGNVNYQFLSDYHLFLNGDEIKDLVIPSTIKSIPDYVFAGCIGLTSIIIEPT